MNNTILEIQFRWIIVLKYYSQSAKLKPSVQSRHLSILYSGRSFSLVWSSPDKNLIVPSLALRFSSLSKYNPDFDEKLIENAWYDLEKLYQDTYIFSTFVHPGPSLPYLSFV